MNTQNLLRPAPYRTSSFHFDRQSRLFTAEISDLRAVRSGAIFERVWNDSADEGLTLVSTRTGREVVYVVTDVVSREGDLLYWDLVSVNDSQPAIRIFND